MQQPLSGINVLELGSFITAPYAAMILADFGATVVKIERPGGGDPFRAFKGGLYSAHFRAYNRRKRSLTLDLTKPAGKRIVEQLAERSDVLLENFRAGFLDEAGLGYEALSARNPRLVYCSINGFGADGPYRDRPSYDTVGTALSGLLSLYVDPENPQSTGVALSDSVTGMYSAIGALGGLMQRERTGKGMRVESTMLGATIAFTENSFADYFLNGTVPGPLSKAHLNQSFTLRCADGKMVAIHLSSPPKFWEGLVAAAGDPPLTDDPRFVERMSRVAHYEDLRLELTARFARQPRAYWLAQLEANDVPFAPIYGIDEVQHDAQVEFMRIFREVVHPTEGPSPMIQRPVRYDGDTGAETATAPPVLGEHVDEVLRGLGYAPDEIAKLRADKIV
jgi:formyl-CoA transferase